MNEVKLTIGRKGEEQIDSLLNDLIDRIGSTLVTTAKNISPVDTGALRDSIEIKSKDYDNKQVVVGSSLDYAVFQELGTIKMSAQPYLRPALDNLLNELRTI